MISTMKKISAMFPAFGCAYLGNEQEILHGLSGDLGEFLDRAESAVELDRRLFASCRDGYFESELQSQYAVFIYSAVLSRILKRNGIHTDYAAGYSMGIYAALHHVESISFELGLEMIDRAYRAIGAAAAGQEFGTCVVSGLGRADLRGLIRARNDCEIVNENSEHSFLVSGLRDSVIELLHRARMEGALYARFLPFGSPYHSRFMNEAAREFDDFASCADMYDPVCPIVSTLDGRLVVTASEAKRDLVNNINRPISWHATVNAMTRHGVNQFIECGPGKSLCRMLRFIGDGVSAYHIQNITSLIDARRVSAQANAVFC